MKKSVMMGLLALALSGCGADLCGKLEECAKKSGTAFSVTECRTEQKTTSERVSSKGCQSDYSAVESCVAGLTCDQLADPLGVSTNCGAKVEKLSKCLE